MFSTPSWLELPSTLGLAICYRPGIYIDYPMVPFHQSPLGVSGSSELHKMMRCKWLYNSLKGQFVFFEVGSYKAHIYSRSVPYHDCRSVQPQFGEVESRSSPDAQLCTAVNSSSVRCIYYTEQVTNTQTESKHVTNTIEKKKIKTVEPPHPYSLAQLGFFASSEIQCEAQLLDERFTFYKN